MPRIARVVAIDYPHHVIQRGNNRQKVFFAIGTRKKYLGLLKEYTQKWDISILAYCLMSNHIHLLVKPKEGVSLAKMMQGVSQGYSRYINRRYKRTGRLWESRYYSCVVDKEEYLWSVARYIEQNPKRIGVVDEEEDYPYSSAKAHIWGEENGVINEELFDESSRIEYTKFLKARIPGKEINNIRNATKTGKPLGNRKFIIRIGKILNRRFPKSAPGTPHK